MHCLTTLPLLSLLSTLALAQTSTVPMSIPSSTSLAPFPSATSTSTHLVRRHYPLLPNAGVGDDDDDDDESTPKFASPQGMPMMGGSPPPPPPQVMSVQGGFIAQGPQIIPPMQGMGQGGALPPRASWEVGLADPRLPANAPGLDHMVLVNLNADCLIVRRAGAAHAISRTSRRNPTLGAAPCGELNKVDLGSITPNDITSTFTNVVKNKYKEATHTFHRIDRGDGSFLLAATVDGAELCASYRRNRNHIRMLPCSTSDPTSKDAPTHFILQKVPETGTAQLRMFKRMSKSQWKKGAKPKLGKCLKISTAGRVKATRCHSKARRSESYRVVPSPAESALPNPSSPTLTTGALAVQNTIAH